MDELKLKHHTYTFKPTAYATDEVRKVMGVRRGTWVLGVALRVGVAFNGTVTISIGDGDDPDGFMTTAQAAIGSTGLKAGWGAYFSAANGKLYTTTDTVDITYDYTADTTQGECTVIITYAEIE
jgi:hypothetical protein